MNIHIFDKKFCKDMGIPRLSIKIGHYCHDSCGHYDCRKKRLCYPKLLYKVTILLFRLKIVSITPDHGKYSGTKYCPHELETVKDCNNCLYHAGYDEDSNGLCSNENYMNMSIDEINNAIDNGFIRCRYWEPNESYKPKQ